MTTGSRKELTGLLTHCGNEELLEREETRRSRDALFRVEVVGSNPAGPTIPLCSQIVSFSGFS